jgi:hypothetical protein
MCSKIVLRTVNILRDRVKRTKKVVYDLDLNY